MPSCLHEQPVQGTLNPACNEKKREALGSSGMSDYHWEPYWAPDDSADPNDVRTWFLFARPSFTMGYGSILSLFGGLFRYNVSAGPIDADTRAAYADWRMIGQDLRDVMVARDMTFE